jgi:hypothetical protein
LAPLAKDCCSLTWPPRRPSIREILLGGALCFLFEVHPAVDVTSADAAEEGSSTHADGTGPHKDFSRTTANSREERRFVSRLVALTLVLARRHLSVAPQLGVLIGQLCLAEPAEDLFQQHPYLQVDDDAGGVRQVGGLLGIFACLFKIL